MAEFTPSDWRRLKFSRTSGLYGPIEFQFDDAAAAMRALASLDGSTGQRWCHTCPGIPHRVEHPGQLCPACEGTGQAVTTLPLSAHLVGPAQDLAALREALLPLIESVKDNWQQLREAITSVQQTDDPACEGTEAPL